MEKICRNCRFWENSNSEWGECHRYPPYSPSVSFPAMGHKDWCGEFALKGKRLDGGGIIVPAPPEAEE